MFLKLFTVLTLITFNVSAQVQRIGPYYDIGHFQIGSDGRIINSNVPPEFALNMNLSLDGVSQAAVYRSNDRNPGMRDQEVAYSSLEGESRVVSVFTGMGTDFNNYSRSVYRVSGGRVIEALACVRGNKCYAVNEEICQRLELPNPRPELIREMSTPILTSLGAAHAATATRALGLNVQYEVSIGSVGSNDEREMRDLTSACRNMKINSVSSGGSPSGGSSGGTSISR